MKLQLKIAFLISIIFSIATSADFIEKIYKGNIMKFKFLFIIYMCFISLISYADKPTCKTVIPYISGSQTVGMEMGVYEITNKQVCEVYNEALNDPNINLPNNYSSKVTRKEMQIYRYYDSDLEDWIDEKIYFNRLLINLGEHGIGIKFINGRFKEITGFENKPCTGITWYGAVYYCYHLNIQYNLPNSYDLSVIPANGETSWLMQTTYIDLDNDGINDDSVLKKGFRLPTENEWFNTAYGNHLYSGSDIIAEVAAYKYNSRQEDRDDEKSTNVGEYNKNQYLLHDMTGNVWEWCHDTYIYIKDDVKIPKYYYEGKIRKSWKTLRGGSWGFTDEICSFKANRRGYKGEKTRIDIGFRVCKTIY